MCGIAGIYEKHPQHTGALPAMLQQMIARGPDDEGQSTISVAAGGAWHIGTRRLAILDLSPAGHQPMRDEAQGNWLAYNGEVFNFQELRDQLCAAGIVFHSHCDTEVILRGFGHWGESVFAKLEGMFAIAIWDAPRQQMLLVRDRHGIKPLYTCAANGSFLFASELRALLATGLVARRLDPIGLDSFLKFGSVQEPATLVAGVEQVPAGCVVRWSAGQRSVAPYVKLFAQIPGTNGHAPQRQAIIEELRATLLRALRLRLISDVPLGVFLSGGMDSTAIAALASSLQKPVRTFNVTFPEKGFAEGELASQVARELNTEHQTLLLSENELLRGLPGALDALDQPSVDGINTYFVSKLTKQAGVTVVLSGLGGDELFAGYGSFRQVPRMEMLGGALPPWLARGAGSVLGRALRTQARIKLAAWLAREDGYGDPYFVTRMLLLPHRIAELLQPEWLLQLDFTAAAAALRGLQSSAAHHDSVNRVSCLEMGTYMRNTLLRDTDCMSMAHSLEVRAPLLDHELTALVLRIPGAWKLQKDQNKPLLVAAMAGRMPSAVLARPKRGFEFPWPAWLRGELREEVDRTLQEPGPVLAQALRWEGVRACWSEFLRGREHWSRPWLFYVLRKWTEQHLSA